MRFIGLRKSTRRCWPGLAVFSTGILMFSGSMIVLGQGPSTPQPPRPTVDAAQQNNLLLDQIAALRGQVAKLQADTEQAPYRQKSGAKTGANMGMMNDKGGPGGMPARTAMPGAATAMKDDQEAMGGMPSGTQSPAPGAPAAAMGMCCKGNGSGTSSSGSGGMSGKAQPAGGMAGMSGGAQPAAGGMVAMSGPPSAMPGQPGTSHLYHIGSTGFFLNHSQHITLTQDQVMTLSLLKEKSMLGRVLMQQQMDQAEQEIYAMTSADQPDTSKIQAKVAQIEKLRGEERMNFIRAVGEATHVLSHAQYLALMGTMPAVKN